MQWRCAGRCEVRSGPEFLLRKYTFYSSGRFDAIQFYYADSECREPAFSVETQGLFWPLHRSWAVRGGTEVDYEATHVAVVAYTDAVATALQRTVNGTCSVGDPRKPNRSIHKFPHYTAYSLQWTSCAGGRHNMPRLARDLDLWPFDLESGVLVKCDVG